MGVDRYNTDESKTGGGTVEEWKAHQKQLSLEQQIQRLTQQIHNASSEAEKVQLQTKLKAVNQVLVKHQNRHTH